MGGTGYLLLVLLWITVKLPASLVMSAADGESDRDQEVDRHRHACADSESVSLDSIKPNQNDRICHKRCKTRQKFLFVSLLTVEGKQFCVCSLNLGPIVLLFQHERLRQAERRGINSNDSFLLRVCEFCSEASDAVWDICCGIKELTVTNDLILTHTCTVFVSHNILQTQSQTSLHIHTCYTVVE